MHGLSMDYQLTIPAILRRTESLFGAKKVVSRLADRSVHRYTYAECTRRAKRLATALARLGLRPGDRVATLCWNHYRHLEAYYAVPASGLVLHTLNLRLHPDELAYIASHAGDRAIIVDAVLWPLFEKFRARVPFEHVIVVADGASAPDRTLEYESLIEDIGDEDYSYPELDERAAGVMCYTSGTTGKPKGVVYSHRALVLHSMASSMMDTLAIGERDTVLAVVPMFHANAWGTPFTAALVGASQVFPGPHMDAKSIVELLAEEEVTIAAGVPTIWLGILQFLDANQGRYDLSRLHTMLVGGAAVPEAVVRALQERHGLHVLHAWGMTELAPLGSVSRLPSSLRGASSDVQYAYRAKQGPPAPFVEVRARGDEGLVPWDGATMGELEVRGPWVSCDYHDCAEGRVQFTDDGWFRTGDIVTLEANGYITIQDRAKDLVKSGGEWISTVALEGALVGHPDVTEAVVIAVPHPKWDERPLAVVVPSEGRSPTIEELNAFLAPSFSKWSLPDDVVLVASIPRTGTGKYLKSALREAYRGHFGTRTTAAGEARDGASKAVSAPSE